MTSEPGSRLPYHYFCHKYMSFFFNLCIFSTKNLDLYDLPGDIFILVRTGDMAGQTGKHVRFMNDIDQAIDKLYNNSL